MAIEVGTAEPAVQNEVKRKKRPNLTSGGGNSGNNGRNRGGGGGGDNRNDEPFFDEINEYRPNKLRVGMWFFLVVVVMTFGGLMGAYIVIATNNNLEWRPFELPKQIWVSTFFILLSSITFEFSRLKLKQNQQLISKYLLLATTALGGVFIASQLTVWIQLVKNGVYVKSNQYAGLFYILTATHALHVLGGIIALGYILLRVWNPTTDERELSQRQNAITVTTWFWHTLGILWIVLVALIGFYK